jgi:protein O-mannosyl-transferase
MRRLLIPLGLVALVLLVYGRTAGFDFLMWDDDVYVTQNPIVQRGLTVEGLRWVFTHEHGANWHPVTGLSHMLDCELFGLSPAGPHLVNVGLHALNTLLLLGLLCSAAGAWGARRAPTEGAGLPEDPGLAAGGQAETSARSGLGEPTCSPGAWRASVLCAALFALHPLHVESVAWISERKDVLSAAFGLGALWAWVVWTRRGGIGRYLGAVVLYALGLMAKPMLVTLPFAMLLLDAWPLGRLRGAVGRRVVEKLPFLALSAAVSLATFVMQRSSDAMWTPDELPYGVRIANAVVSYVRYLGKTVWPVDLAAFYPHPGFIGGKPLTTPEVAGAAIVLVVLSGLVFGVRRGYATVGWLWFVGMLVPVIGIVQVGAQAMADRYTYLPLIGIFLAAAFGLEEVVERVGRARPGVRPVASAAAALVVAACAVRSWVQVGVWRDTITLLEHSLAVAPGSPLVHTNLGNAYFVAGRYPEAARELRTALIAAPGLEGAHFNLALTARELGDSESALQHFSRALELGSDPVRTHQELARTLEEIGRSAEAEEQRRMAREAQGRGGGAR